MEVFSKSISETKKLAIDVDQRKAEKLLSEIDLSAEEQNASILKKELDNLCQLSANLQQTSEHLKTRAGLHKSFCDVIKSSMLRFAVLKQFMAKAEPTEEEQKLKKEHLKSNYNLMQEKYEDTPLFNAILQEQAAEKDLVAKILEKRNELMKLETEYSTVINS